MQNSDEEAKRAKEGVKVINIMRRELHESLDLLNEVIRDQHPLLHLLLRAARQKYCVRVFASWVTVAGGYHLLSLARLLLEVHYCALILQEIALFLIQINLRCHQEPTLVYLVSRHLLLLLLA